jgi:CheY-like chemotaxis protein
VAQNGREGLEGIHVLLIDVDMRLVDAVRRILEPLGVLVTTTTATEADTATLLADVIACDLQLAEAAGAPFLHRVRRRHVRRGRPAAALAFVSGMTFSPQRVDAAGFQAYVRVPIDGDALRRAIWQLTSG